MTCLTYSYNPMFAGIENKYPKMELFNCYNIHKFSSYLLLIAYKQFEMKFQREIVKQKKSK